MSRQLNFLICNEYTTGLQWYKDGVEIPLATSQFLNLENVSLAPGCYTVAYSNSTCTTISDCYNVVLIGLNDSKSTSSISANLYPNPAESNLNIDLSSSSTSSTAQIFTLAGYDVTSIVTQSDGIELINGKNNLDISSLETGIYIIKISNGGNEIVRKFSKE